MTTFEENRNRGRNFPLKSRERGIRELVESALPSKGGTQELTNRQESDLTIPASIRSGKSESHEGGKTDGKTRPGRQLNRRLGSDSPKKSSIGKLVRKRRARIWEGGKGNLQKGSFNGAKVKNTEQMSG